MFLYLTITLAAVSGFVIREAFAPNPRAARFAFAVMAAIGLGTSVEFVHRHNLADSGRPEIVVVEQAPPATPSMWCVTCPQLGPWIEPPRSEVDLTGDFTIGIRQ